MAAPVAAAGAAGPPDEDDDRRSRTGLIVLLVLLFIGLIAAAAYLLPQLFESPPEEQRVPEVVGETEEDARGLIGDAGLAVGEVTFRTDPDAKRDIVLEQDPNPDQFVAPGTEVDLVVSSGKPLADVPYVLDQPRSQARATLEDAGFEVRESQRESDEPRGSVLETDPAPGSSVPEGSTVTLFWSDGPEEVPDVTGFKRPRAEQVLSDAGFQVDVVETTDTTEQRGTVIRQSPPGGSDAAQGSTVTIVVSAFEEPTETPRETPRGTPSETPSETPSPTETASPTLPTDTTTPDGGGRG